MPCLLVARWARPLACPSGQHSPLSAPWSASPTHQPTHPTRPPTTDAVDIKTVHPSVGALLSWRYAQLLTALPRRGTEAAAWEKLARALHEEAPIGGLGSAPETAFGTLDALSVRGGTERGPGGGGLCVWLAACTALSLDLPRHMLSHSTVHPLSAGQGPGGARSGARPDVPPRAAVPAVAAESERARAALAAAAAAARRRAARGCAACLLK